MRIVAGKHRGLSLEEFDADNIRPTTDRVRENIFNKIQFDIPESSNASSTLPSTVWWGIKL